MKPSLLFKKAYKQCKKGLAIITATTVFIMICVIMMAFIDMLVSVLLVALILSLLFSVFKFSIKEHKAAV